MTSIATLVAEYNTIVTLADGERWERFLRDAGLDGAELARAQNSTATTRCSRSYARRRLVVSTFATTYRRSSTRARSTTPKTSRQP